MNIRIALLIFVSAAVSRGCCTATSRVEPKPPSATLGWKLMEERGVRISGKFLLHRNEATSNGKIQLKVLDISPGDPCAEDASHLNNPNTKLQFVRLLDGQVLCEHRFYEGESGSLKCGQDLSQFNVLGLSVNAINLKEDWVFVEVLE